MKITIDINGNHNADSVLATLRRALEVVIDREGAPGFGTCEAEKDLLAALPSPNNVPRVVTDDDLEEWTAKLHEMKEIHRIKHSPRVPPTPITFERGRKYARIVVNHPNQRMAFCFIDLGNGDILKTNGWKGPAKHPRGNIFAPDPLAGVTLYGAEYLR